MYKIYTSIILTLLLAFSTTAMAGPGGGKKPGGSTIYEIANSTGIHTTLVALLDRVGLGETGATNLAGQFTVFAPTDQAFDEFFAALYANLPADTVDGLLADDDYVTGVLLYHVLDGRRFSNSVFNKNNMKGLETLCGEQYLWSKSNLTIMDENALTADAGIVPDGKAGLLANISASNGVIHVTDAVFLPGGECTD
jgi:uncharacterized surface protein with fasciclin (FAS1) repeats